MPGGLPYLSVVATARNDNHGGDLLYRIRLFVDGLVAQCERHRVPAELILVEWNPPTDRPRLADALEWPPSEWCAIRIVEVPHELHARLEHSDRLPLFQMIAKNVGIRRARGEFVLATNVDLLFSDGLMRAFERRTLQPGRLYRADRHDIPAEVDPEWPIDRELAYAASHVLRVNERNGTRNCVTGEYYRIYPRSASFPLLASLRSVSFGFRVGTFVFRRLYGLVYWFVAGFNDPRQVPARIKRRLRRLARVRSRGVHPVATEVEGGAHGFRAKLALLREAWEWEKSRVPLHTNASGDFTLASRADWERLRGYPELEMFSMHIDGLFLYLAHYAGITEKVLPDPVYHLEHGSGFRPEPAKVRELNERIEKAAIPQISGEQFRAWALEMYRTRRPIEFNDDRWGFADEELPEVAAAHEAVAP